MISIFVVHTIIYDKKHLLVLADHYEIFFFYLQVVIVPDFRIFRYIPE